MSTFISSTCTLRRIGGTFVLLALIIALAFPAASARAQSVADLQAQINQLLAAISALQAQIGTGGTAAVCPHTWTRSLTRGSTGADVMALQQFLNSDPETRVAASGVGSAGMETQTYGPLTAAAVSKFQVKYRADVLTPLGLVNPTGYFGPSSRAKANELCASAPPTTPPPTEEEPGLEGGAGSAEYRLMTSLRDEEVGERQDNVDVAGLEVRARGSDLEINTVRLVFEQGTADRPFDRYARDVSIWLNGERYARVNASEFNRQNDYSRTITLDRGAIIREGRTGDLVVAVSGANSIDSQDRGETWTVDFASVRYRDAQNVTISENPNTPTRSFRFDAFAAAAGVDVRIAAGDRAINDPRVIELRSTGRTDNVELLSFDLDIRGRSDITFFGMPIRFESDGANLDQVLSSVYLEINGNRVGSEGVTVASTTGTITFDDLDVELRGDRVHDVVVRADVRAGVTEGTTVAAFMTSAERDAIDAEDESGSRVRTSDLRGTAAAGPHGLFREGIRSTFVDSSFVRNTSTTPGINETVQFTLRFDVTAFGQDVWVDKTCAVGTTTQADALVVSLDGDADGSSTTCVDFSSTGTEGTEGFRVREGTTERFTVTILGDGGEAGAAGNSVTFRARVHGIGFNAGSDADGDRIYAFNMTDYRSSAVTVFSR